MNGLVKLHINTNREKENMKKTKKNKPYGERTKCSKEWKGEQEKFYSVAPRCLYRLDM